MPRIEYCYHEKDGVITPTHFTVMKLFRTAAGMKCACDRLMKEFNAMFCAGAGYKSGAQFAVFPIDKLTCMIEVPYDTPDLAYVLLTIITVMDTCNSKGV